MARKGAIVPADTNPPAEYRRVLCIPGTPEWIALVNGALWVLTQPWYWDAQTGDVDAVTARARQFYYEFQEQNGACDVPNRIIGEITMMANASLPDGWLYCEGDEVAKATYPDLWAVIGTLWGTASNPTDNFLLPDMRNRFPLGFSGDASAPVFASSGGEQNVTLSLSQIPSHAHYIYNERSYAPFAVPGTVGGLGFSGTGGSDTYKTGLEGSGAAHNNMPPYRALSFIIYAGV